MTWQLRIARQAARTLKKVPRKDQDQIARAIAEMRASPFRGDIARLKNKPAAWRCRVGNYRTFFDSETGYHGRSMTRREIVVMSSSEGQTDGSKLRRTLYTNNAGRTRPVNVSAFLGLWFAPGLVTVAVPAYCRLAPDGSDEKEVWCRG